MSSAGALRLLCHHSFTKPVYSHQSFGLPRKLDFNRQFTTTPAILAPKVTKRKTLTKKVAAAKAKKRALKARKSIYAHEQMTLTDAIAVLRAKEVTSPNATYELVIKTLLGRGMTVPKGRITLPREAKPKREEVILVFAEGRLAEEARKAGAHIVGGAELVDGILTRRYNATVILSTTPLIRAITPKLGRVLGPLGLMPSERRGTVTDDIPGYISRLQGSSEWRGDKDGTIRAAIAKLSFPIDDVAKNVRAFVGSVKRVTGNTKELGKREQQKQSNNNKKDTKPVIPITKILLSSPHGPGIKLLDM